MFRGRIIHTVSGVAFGGKGYVLTKLRFTNTILNRFQMFILTLMVMVMLLLMLPLMLLLMVIITVNGNTNLMLLLTPPPHMHQFLVTK